MVSRRARRALDGNGKRNGIGRYQQGGRTAPPLSLLFLAASAEALAVPHALPPQQEVPVRSKTDSSMPPFQTIVWAVTPCWIPCSS